MVVDHAPLLGHEEALQAVRRMRLQQCLPHALLLTGPDGVGKTTFALTVAADLACDDLQSDGGHCGVCRGCTLALAGSHPDILRIAPPKEETTIGQMRELRYVANLAPNLSSRRVIVIEKAETLNDQAANAILKV
ncbi:MAG: DNA polymerase III subunit delta', partial [Armatimonadota bacterium]